MSNMRHITYDFGFNLKENALLFQAFSFKLNPKSYVICLILEILVGFYFETPHQNVLKLLVWPYGVVNYNPEVKWAWNNRAFSFKLNPKSYVICKFWDAITVMASIYSYGKKLSRLAWPPILMSRLAWPQCRERFDY